MESKNNLANVIEMMEEEESNDFNSLLDTRLKVSKSLSFKVEEKRDIVKSDLLEAKQKKR